MFLSHYHYRYHVRLYRSEAEKEKRREGKTDSEGQIDEILHGTDADASHLWEGCENQFLQISNAVYDPFLPHIFFII